MSFLSVELGVKSDLAWAQDMVEERHYLRSRVHNQARPMVYVIRGDGRRLGLIMVGLPHATVCGGWWGKPGLPTQWQVVDLCRIWIDPAIQWGGVLSEFAPGFFDRKGYWRPTVATWAIDKVLQRVQRDRVSLWPPVYLDKPYHIQLAISYHDPNFHKGTIYKLSGAQPMFVDGNGRHKPNPSGKYGWAWRLPDPDWSWEDIVIRKPRTLRLF